MKNCLFEKKNPVFPEFICNFTNGKYFITKRHKQKTIDK